VAFQGERGAYGDDAIQHRWRSATAIPSWTFDDVVRAVMRGTADYGVLPIENTVVGAVAPAQAALTAAPELHVVDDIVVPIRHALLAPPGATFERITLVTSHPVALAQCGHFLRRHTHLRLQEAYDTAGAARDVAARNDPTESAIASVAAAARYKLQVMATDIQDVPNNVTRFVVIAARPNATPAAAAAMASLASVES
jgi:prephenate dehydratase